MGDGQTKQLNPSPQIDFDLAIVGAGPAGLSTALYAAHAHLSVVVIDKKEPPIDKACGEGLMPEAFERLQRLGVVPPAWGQHAFTGIEYIDERRSARGSFDTPGLGVRRLALSEALYQRARETSIAWRIQKNYLGHYHDTDLVVVQLDEEKLRVRYLIGADGLHSKVRENEGIRFQKKKSARYGIRQHYATPPWNDRVEVHWNDVAEAYVTPVGPNLVGVAVLFRKPSASIESWLECFPALKKRLENASVASKRRGAGPFQHKLKRRVTKRVALVGDSAGYIDAITGEGIALAFESAESVVSAIQQENLQLYEQDYRRFSRTYYVMTQLLLSIARLPSLRRRMVAALARYPEVFDRFLTINSNQRAFWDLGITNVLKLVVGLIRG